jgi:hypothetical protein
MQANVGISTGVEVKPVTVTDQDIDWSLRNIGVVRWHKNGVIRSVEEFRRLVGEYSTLGVPYVDSTGNAHQSIRLIAGVGPVVERALAR